MQPKQQTLHETFQATPQAVPEARHRLVQFARCCRPDPPEELVDAVALAVSEAVGNVVRHAYPAHAGTVELCATSDDQALLITITDHGVGLDTPTSDPGQGLGLRIMQSMADADVRPLAAGGVQVSLRFSTGPD